MIRSNMAYGLGVVCFAALLLVPVAVGAQPGEGLYLAENEEKQRGWKIVPEGQVLYQDYDAIGEVVEVLGTVHGDVYVLGGQIFIDGLVDGDVLALGGVVHISGEVTQNVRVAGGEVMVSGTIGRNATVAAMHVTFTDSAEVHGSLAIGGVNVFLASPVGKEVKVGGRNLTLANAIGGDVEAAVENVRLTGRARVEGNFTYWSNKEALIDEGALVLGTQERKSPRQLTGRIGEFVEPITRWIRPVLGISSFFTTFVLGLLLIRLFPHFSETTVHTLKTARWRSLTTGITALLIIPLLFGILIITIVGIPLGFLLLFLSWLILYVARIFVMLLAGQLLLERFGTVQEQKRSPSSAFILGLVLYSLLVLLPVVGWFVSLGAMLFGLGAMAETTKELYGKKKNTIQAQIQ